jgi:hypothetical protein
MLKTPSRCVIGLALSCLAAGCGSQPEAQTPVGSTKKSQIGADDKKSGDSSPPIDVTEERKNKEESKQGRTKGDEAPPVSDARYMSLTDGITQEAVQRILGGRPYKSISKSYTKLEPPTSNSTILLHAGYIVRSLYYRSKDHPDSDVILRFEGRDAIPLTLLPLVARELKRRTGQDNGAAFENGPGDSGNGPVTKAGKKSPARTDEVADLITRLNLSAKHLQAIAVIQKLGGQVLVAGGETEVPALKVFVGGGSSFRGADISLLAELPNVREVSLENALGGQVTDISYLAGLKDLKVLHVSPLPPDQFAILAGLPQLASLNCSCRQPKREGPPGPRKPSEEDLVQQSLSALSKSNSIRHLRFRGGG